MKKRLLPTKIFQKSDYKLDQVNQIIELRPLNGDSSANHIHYIDSLMLPLQEVEVITEVKRNRR